MAGAVRMMSDRRAAWSCAALVAFAVLLWMILLGPWLLDLLR